jgi:pimeloyl-ACP methyl ester carboxylesterase
MFEKNTSVFIPGLLSDSRVWKPLAELLECVPYSHFADVSGLTSLREMAIDILSATEGRLNVYGHSMGGRIALELFDLAPHRVNTLILADTGVHPLSKNEPAKREAVISLAYEQGIEALCEKWLPPMIAVKYQTDIRLMNDLREMVLQYSADQHENQIRALINRRDARQYLPKINCPVLLVVGSEDVWSPPEQHQQMLTEIKNGELIVLEGAGHFAPIENAKAFAEVIRNWQFGQ